MRRLHVLIALTLTGCAHLRRLSGPARTRRAAVRTTTAPCSEYSKAVQEHPDNLGYRKGCRRRGCAPPRSTHDAGRRLLESWPLQGSAGRVQARARPQPRLVHAAARDRGRRDAAAGRARPRPPSTRCRTARASAACPVSCSARARSEPLGLSFRNASLREVYQALGKAAGVNFVFDPAVPGAADHDRPAGRGLRAGAQRHRQRRPHLPPRARLAGASWWCRTRPTSAATYEQQVGEDLLPVQRRPQGDDRPPADRARGAAGGAACPERTRSPSTTRRTRCAAAERIVDIVDKQRAEVMVEVEILEVNRGKLKGVRDRDHVRPPGSERHRGRDLPRRTSRRRCGTRRQSLYDRTRPITVDDNPYSPRTSW